MSWSLRTCYKWLKYTQTESLYNAAPTHPTLETLMIVTRDDTQDGKSRVDTAEAAPPAYGTYEGPSSTAYGAPGPSSLPSVTPNTVDLPRPVTSAQRARQPAGSLQVDDIGAQKSGNNPTGYSPFWALWHGLKLLILAPFFLGGAIVYALGSIFFATGKFLMLVGDIMSGRRLRKQMDAIEERRQSGNVV